MAGVGAYGPAFTFRDTEAGTRRMMKTGMETAREQQHASGPIRAASIQELERAYTQGYLIRVGAVYALEHAEAQA